MTPAELIDELFTTVCAAHLTPGVTTGWVYFFGDSESVKIGWTEQLGPRIASLRTANPRAILETWCAGTPKLEARLHALLGADRIRGEWFRRSPDVEDLIATVMENVEADDQELVDEERADRVEVLA